MSIRYHLRLIGCIWLTFRLCCSGFDVLPNIIPQHALKAFIQSSEVLVEPDEFTAAAQRQQTTARQFFENEELITPILTDDENEIKRLIQEQKAIRERSRQKNKKRTH